MARVFQATLTGPGGFTKQVAVKVIRPQQEPLTADHVQRFSIEARLGGLLLHPNVVDIYDFGAVHAQPFIAMELIEGVTVRQMIRQLGPLPPSVLLAIASQTCDGLAHAHGLTIDGTLAGLVHRDLTPGNIMLTHQGIAKVMDFGLARVWDESEVDEAGEVLQGTPAYMSPEQIRNAANEPASDLFALGAVIYFMATGVKFFDAPTVLAALMQVQHVEDVLRGETISNLDSVAAGLARIVRRCLRFEVADRYASAVEVRHDIEAIRSQIDSEPRLRAYIEEHVVGHETGVFSLDSASNIATRTLDSDRSGEHRSDDTFQHLMTPRTNVGEERTGFIGRVADLGDVHAHITAEHRLVTILGAGGSGKTRLAHRFVKELLEMTEPRWEVWWCDLSAARDLDGIVQAVAAAIGVPVYAVPTTEEQVTHLGEAMAERTHILLVLDNFEQVATIAKESVGRWLQVAPTARFVVTSQVRLHVTGEVCQRLDVLEEQDALALFLERAERAGGDPEALRQDLDTIRELTRRLDHLPLAIELAAAHATVLSPRQIVDRLSSRFRLLRSKAVDTTHRHQSLEQALNWSWELLEPWAQSCLAQLSVFAGSFQIEDAEGVVDLSAFPDAPWILFVVEALIDASLVQTVPGQGAQRGARFQLTNSVREYAERQLGDGQLSAYQRHVQWYAQYGDMDYVLSLRTHGGDDRRRRLIHDRLNLLAAADRAIQNQWTELAVRVGHITMTILNTLGPLSAVMDLGGRLLVLPLNEPQRCRVLMGMTWSKIDLDYEGTVRDLVEALGLVDTLGPTWVKAACLSNLGAVYLRGSRIEEALEALERSDRMCIEVGLTSVRATTVINLGMIYSHQGDHEAAREHYTRGLTLAEGHGNVRAVCQAHINLGDVYRVLGDPAQARSHLDRGIAIAASLGYRRKHIVLLINHIEIDLETDELALTADRLEAAMVLAEDVGEPRLIGVLAAHAAQFAKRHGDRDAAWAFIQRAEENLHVHQNSAWLGEVLCLRATFEIDEGRLDDARATLERVDGLVRDIGAGTDVQLKDRVEEVRASLSAHEPR
jgi:serine/threonine protein kinase/predicted ATPase/Tfp pilus assembly protein PilF